MEIEEVKDEVMKNFREFEQFDIVTDPSDHHFINEALKNQNLSQSTVKAIQKEWNILGKKDNLPRSIFVRVYEERMDLLRAVIVGPYGTPYSNGLFFFDIFLPPDYPKNPPQVYYHAHGLRINPNLYVNGKVCLSLLNTWFGEKRERWNPKSSTLLQVLVSIQALVLNAEPYFNEPGFIPTAKTRKRESIRYNNNVFILSSKTMVYTLQSPPKHFKDFVKGHFRNNAHSILTVCEHHLTTEKAVMASNMLLSALEVNGADCSHFNLSLKKPKKEMFQEFLLKAWGNLKKTLGMKKKPSKFGSK